MNGLRLTEAKLKELGFDADGCQIAREPKKRKKLPAHSDFQERNVYKNNNYLTSTMKFKEK